MVTLPFILFEAILLGTLSITKTVSALLMCIVAFQKWNPGLCLKLRVREPATAYFS